jgi:hypothetical protein
VKPETAAGHMSDSQSFPFESKTHPKLWEAAWSVQERFSQLDVRGHCLSDPHQSTSILLGGRLCPLSFTHPVGPTAGLLLLLLLLSLPPLQVQDVVEFARMHGVRVMVEWDTPGHAASWCKGYPEVCPSTSCTQPLNPATPATFELIESLLGECTGKKQLAGLFPESMSHLGGAYTGPAR